MPVQPGQSRAVLPSILGLRARWKREHFAGRLRGMTRFTLDVRLAGDSRADICFSHGERRVSTRVFQRIKDAGIHGEGHGPSEIMAKGQA